MLGAYSPHPWSQHSPSPLWALRLTATLWLCSQTLFGWCLKAHLCPCFPPALMAQLASHLLLHCLQLLMYHLSRRDNRVGLPTHTKIKEGEAPIGQSPQALGRQTWMEREPTVWWERQTYRPAVPAPIRCEALWLGCHRLPQA